MRCPIATQDIKANLKARDWAFKNVGYGPLKPDEANTRFWKDKAEEWDCLVDDAKQARCGNCAAFIQTEEMLDCILNGIDEETDGYAANVMNAADLGYCELFDFKCAADRTCSAWLTGGPVTGPRLERDVVKNQILKRHYRP